MRNKAYKTLLILFCIFSLSVITSCVKTRQIKSDIIVNNNKTKLIYEFKNIMSTDIAFIPATNKAVINNSVEALIVDFNANKTLSTIPSPEPGEFINNIKVSTDNNRLLVSSPMAAQVWNVAETKLLGSFKAEKNSPLSGISPNGDLVLFNKHLYNISTSQSVMPFSQDAVPLDYDFSDDGHYLAISGHTSGTGIINIKTRQQLDTIFEKGMQQIHFNKDNHLYAAYNSKLLPEIGGYYAASIGVFDINSRKRLHEYTPSSRISCWVKLADNKILATLTNGSLELLNEQLVAEKSWQLGDKVTACATEQNNTAWLASEKTGVYLINSDTGEISRVIETTNDPVKLVVSDDGKYLGIVKSVRDGSHVNVYSIN